MKRERTAMGKEKTNMRTMKKRFSISQIIRGIARRTGLDTCEVCQIVHSFLDVIADGADDGDGKWEYEYDEDDCWEDEDD